MNGPLSTCYRLSNGITRMIDYAKLLLPAEVGAGLLHHPLLSFRRLVDEQTGELTATDARCAEHRGMIFTYYPSGWTTLHGSLHKYAQGGTNWGDFTFTQFAVTVAELCHTFDLDPHTLRLLHLEAGANVRPPIRTSRALQAIVCHREGHAFSVMRSRTGRSLGLELYRDQFGIKIYDKGRQYDRPFDLLRFEVKFIKGAPLHRMDLYTLNDLLNPDAWQRLQTRVMGIYDELVIAEPSIDLPSLTASQRTFVTLATSAGYWQGLTKGARYKARARYDDIVQRFAGRNLKDDLRFATVAKLDALRDLPPQAAIGHPFTNIPAGPPNNAGSPFPTSVNVGTGPPVEVGNCSAVELVTTAPDPVRRCLTCGRDITDQRKGSRYCSEQRYGKDAKRCRNAGSNPRNNRLRSLERIERDPLLFDHGPFIASPQP